MPNKLSNSDARTIRIARQAIAMLISGAIRDLESNFGPNDEQSRVFAVDALILHIREEISGWETTAENLGHPELTIAETALPTE